MSPGCWFTVVVIVTCLASEGLALQLPDYIKACARNDPNIHECALKSARAAFPKIINGDRKYRVPPLDPLIITELKVDQNSGSQTIGFGFTAKNCSLFGVKDTIIDRVVMDLPHDRFEYYVTFPRLEIITKYNVSGRILLLPIVGKGDANITLTDVKVSYKVNVTYEPRADGNYTTPVNPEFDFQVLGRMYIKLDNLFNGDPLLENEMNNFLNENWKEVLKDVGPTIGETISEVIRQILAGIFDTVSIENTFPESV